MTALLVIIAGAYTLIGVLLAAGPISKELRSSLSDIRTNGPSIGLTARVIVYLALVTAGGVLGWPMFLVGWVRAHRLRSSSSSGSGLDAVVEHRPEGSLDSVGVRWVGDSLDACDQLRRIWEANYIPPLYHREIAEWTVGFAPSFRKAIGSVDKNLQGRILEALANICAAPLTSQGDTKKPLEGKLKGLWRYRIGDYRLIYQPERDSAKVILVDFVARGDAYS